MGELSQDLPDAQRVDEVACELQSDSDKLHQVVWGGEGMKKFTVWVS